MRTRTLLAAAALCVVAVMVVSCNLFGLQDLPEDVLVYSGPVEQHISAGSRQAGTGIEYVGRTPDRRAEVRIDGQRAFKRTGGSLGWQGERKDGVLVDLKQRVLWFNEERLQLGGVLRMEIDDVQPQPGPIPEVPDEPDDELIAFSVPVVYQVVPGETIPGTTLRYAGTGAEGAIIEGLPEGDYPYRRAADSIDWEGRLRPGVHLDLVLRVVSYGEDGLDATGLARIIIGTDP